MSQRGHECPQGRLPVLQPTLQMGFFGRLKDDREERLLPALLAAVGEADVAARELLCAELGIRG